MAKRVTVRLENGQKHAFEEMERDGAADSQSEALRRALNVGLAELGYLNGQNRDTRIRMVARRFADAFALLGVLLLGTTFWLPLEIRMYVVAPFAMALACWGLDRFLEGHEPAVSNRLAGLFTGERA